MIPKEQRQINKALTTLLYDNSAFRTSMDYQPMGCCGIVGRNNILRLKVEIGRGLNYLSLDENRELVNIQNGNILHYFASYLQLAYEFFEDRPGLVLTTYPISPLYKSIDTLFHENGFIFSTPVLNPNSLNSVKSASIGSDILLEKHSGVPENAETSSLSSRKDFKNYGIVKIIHNKICTIEYLPNSITEEAANLIPDAYEDYFYYGTRGTQSYFNFDGMLP